MAPAKRKAEPAEIVEEAYVIEECSDLVITKMQPGLDIEANFEALENHIERIVSDYRGAIVTKDYVPQAKRDRAFLNGLSKSLNQRRIEVKERYMAPVVAFEARVKRLDAPIKEASAAIDAQIKAFEEEEKREKRIEIKKHWEEYAGALADAVDFELINDPAWLNRSFPLMAAFEAVEKLAERIAAEEQMLTELNLSHPVEAKAEYFATLDMSRAIARSKQLDEQIARAAALEAEKAAIIASRETPKPGEECMETCEQGGPCLDKCVIEAEKPETHTWTMTLTCTRDELDSLIAAVKKLGLHGTVARVQKQ